jgi:hypothetical protein
VTPEAAKTAALDALTRWSATARDELVAAAWRAGNRNITELARAAGRHRQAIYDDLRKHGIDPTTDREEPPTMPADTTEVPVPGWRHPSLISVTKDKNRWGYGNVSYVITPFTGDEDQPELPSEWRYGHRPDEPDMTLHDARRQEIGWVRKAWADARFLRVFKALYKRPAHSDRDLTLIEDFLRANSAYASAYSSNHPLGYDDKTAGDVWDAYTTARDELTAAYQAMKTQPDTLWRAGLGRIVDATETAEKAARDWDALAQDFWKIASWYNGTFDSGSEPGEHRALSEVAKTAGVNADDWLISYPGDYRGDSFFTSDATAKGQTANIIKKGQEWLDNVDRLAGNH